MQFNYYFLKKLSERLTSLIKGYVLTNCFSQNKNELILAFEQSTTKDLFYIKAQLDGEVSLMSFPDSFARAKKNSVELFPEIMGQTVSDIKQFVNERSFTIEFSNHTLVFKLHGRRANILLFEGQTIKSLFKNSIVNDNNIKLDELDRPIDQSLESIRNSNYHLKKHFPTFDKNITRWLENQSFDSSEDQVKKQILSSLLSELNDDTYYIKRLENGYQLLLFRPDEPYEIFDDPIAASNAFASVFYKYYHTTSTKSKIISRLNKEISKSKSYILKNSGKLKQLTEGRKYDEIANILMANLHISTSPDQTSIKLHDFYNDREIVIKIKQKSSLQETASNYYKKSKNQSKEVENLEHNIGSKKEILDGLHHTLERLENELDIGELKKLNKQFVSSEHTKELKELPFMEFKVDGYTFWLGRNAKNNDLLTQRYAKKNDLWLHAKDVSGSHGVLRSNGNDKYPLHIIEKVAALAAWHSKRKNDTLCPVLYTLKKHVRKPKGSLPGQVIVAQEDVVLVKPNRTINN